MPYRAGVRSALVSQAPKTLKAHELMEKYHPHPPVVRLDHKYLKKCVAGHKKLAWSLVDRTHHHNVEGPHGELYGWDRRVALRYGFVAQCFSDIVPWPATKTLLRHW